MGVFTEIKVMEEVASAEQLHPVLSHRGLRVVVSVTGGFVVGEKHASGCFAPIRRRVTMPLFPWDGQVAPEPLVNVGARFPSTFSPSALRHSTERAGPADRPWVRRGLRGSGKLTSPPKRSTNLLFLPKECLFIKTLEPVFGWWSLSSGDWPLTVSSDTRSAFQRK